MLFPNDLQRLDLVTGYVSGSEDDAKQWMVALIRRLPTTAENDFEVVVCSSEQDDVESAWADFSWKIEEHMGRRLTAKLKVQD